MPLFYLLHQLLLQFSQIGIDVAFYMQRFYCAGLQTDIFHMRLSHSIIVALACIKRIKLYRLFRSLNTFSLFFVKLSVLRLFCKARMF